MAMRAGLLAMLILSLAAPLRGAEPLPESNREVMEAVLSDKYFPVGAWRIGMKEEEALRHFSEVVPAAGKDPARAVAKTYFAGDLPAELTFARDRLSSVKLALYEGTDFEEAARRMQAALRFMEGNFGGANFEGGLKTSMDLDGKLLSKTLTETIARFETSLAEVEAEAKEKGKAPQGLPAFEMVMNFYTEYVADKNFLLGEFRYRSDSRKYFINLFDDREFVKSRIPEASVMLFRYEPAKEE